MKLAKRLTMKSARGGLWTPAETTTAIWFDPSDADTVTIVDGKVSQLADKSGNNRHVTQGVAANRPGINSVSMLTFNGSAQWFADIPAFSSQFIISVAIRSQNKAYAGLFTATTSELILNASGTGAIATGTVLINGIVQTAIALSAPVTWSIGGATPVNKARSFGQEFNLKGATRAWVGSGGEIISLPTAPTTEIRQKLEGYLAHKWDALLGVTTLVDALPSGHPYKTFAP